MKLYVDDMRQPPDGWIICRSVRLAKGLLTMGYVNELSLDHDMGDGKPTGYDLLCWIEDETANKEDFWPPALHVHSANPVGCARMQQAIARILMLLRNRAISVNHLSKEQ